MLKLKLKGWIWRLTGPFARNNYTCIGSTLYCPKSALRDGVLRVSPTVLLHEMVHAKQQAEVGIVKFLLLYLFCWPLFRNRWRFKWEMEAYTKGSGYPVEAVKRILSGAAYGWLKE